MPHKPSCKANNAQDPLFNGCTGPDGTGKLNTNEQYHSDGNKYKPTMKEPCAMDCIKNQQWKKPQWVNPETGWKAEKLPDK
jgi:hypothetical protein